MQPTKQPDWLLMLMASEKPQPRTQHAAVSPVHHLCNKHLQQHSRRQHLVLSWCCAATQWQFVRALCNYHLALGSQASWAQRRFGQVILSPLRSYSRMPTARSSRRSTSFSLPSASVYLLGLTV